MSTADGDRRIDSSLGQALRSARLRSGMTMAALAQRAEISQPHLSQMENGKVSPSINTLYRLATALEVNPQDLLPSTREADLLVVRAGEAPVATPIVDRTDSALARMLVASPGRTLQVQEVLLEPGQTAGDWFEHDGEEFLYVLSGSLSLEVRDNAPVRLSQGDCAWYTSSLPHRWTSIDDGAVRLLAVSAALPKPSAGVRPHVVAR